MSAAEWRFLFAWIGVSPALSISVAVCAEPDVRTIIQKSVAANEVDFEAAPNYAYRERVRTGPSTKTYDVIMIAGSTYSGPIAINGKPLSPQAGAEEPESR